MNRAADSFFTMAISPIHQAYLNFSIEFSLKTFIIRAPKVM